MTAQPPVEQYHGKFTGMFDLENSLAEDLVMDSPMTFLITTRVSGQALASLADGRIKRSDTFKVADIIPITPELFSQVMDTILGSSMATPVEPEQSPEEAGWIPDEEPVVRTMIVTGDVVEEDPDEIFDPRQLEDEREEFEPMPVDDDNKVLS